MFGDRGYPVVGEIDLFSSRIGGVRVEMRHGRDADIHFGPLRAQIRQLVGIAQEQPEAACGKEFLGFRQIGIPRVDFFGGAGKISIEAQRVRAGRERLSVEREALVERRSAFGIDHRRAGLEHQEREEIGRAVIVGGSAEIDA